MTNDDDLKDLLEVAARDADRSAGPGPEFLDLAQRRLHTRRWQRVAAAGAALGAVAFGSLGVQHGTFTPLLDIAGFHGTAATSTPVASAAAPQCVRTQLAEANHRYVQDQLVAAVIDVPTAKRAITHGISSGSGWDVEVVAVLGGPAAAQPTGSVARVWDGVTPAADLTPGRHVVLLFLDNSPRVPGGTYEVPVFGYVADFTWAVAGDGMTVSCDDGQQSLVRWTDAAQPGGWLGPDAAQVAPRLTVPSGAATPYPPASTTSPTSATPSG
jgi:hypothetical protein